MNDRLFGFLNRVSGWDNDLKNEENNLLILNCVNSLDLVLYHYFYYSQNILKNTFYRIHCLNRSGSNDTAVPSGISSQGNPVRWIDEVGKHLIKSVTITINTDPTPDL